MKYSVKEVIMESNAKYTIRINSHLNVHNLPAEVKNHSKVIKLKRHNYIDLYHILN